MNGHGEINRRFNSRMRQFLHQPLLHFLVLGALLFGGYAWLNRGLPDSPGEITVSRAEVEILHAQFARLWQRPPTKGELEGLIEAWVREEIFYREGMSLGLDRNDPVVRRRVAQKLEFVADGQGASPPTDEQLQAWLAAHRDRYRIAPRYTLRQVYFDPARRGGRIDAEITSAKAALARGGHVRGDSTMLPANLDRVAADEVERQFGSDFAAALENLPVGGWHGPVRSGFGLHLVELRTRDDCREASLGEVRAAVERDFLQHQAGESKSKYYAGLRANYKVRVEGRALVADPDGPGQ